MMLAAMVPIQAHVQPVPPGPLVDVIVRYDVSKGIGTAERPVIRLGGIVGRRLGIIDGFAASLPAGQIATARAAVGVRAVTLNAR
jgi:hypothetical protein